LKPLMFARFSIITGPARIAPAVPESAIVYEGDQARVWVAGRNGTLALREIRTGRSSDDMVEVLSGLSAGERVVTEGTVFIDRAGGTG
jgi:membrane fusion protein, heavy metal efflux system